MKQFTFKDGTKVIASSVEEAKSKHKVVAFKRRKGLISIDEKIDIEKEIKKHSKLLGLKDYNFDVNSFGICLTTKGDLDNTMKSIGKVGENGYIDFDNKEKVLKFIRDNANELKELTDSLRKIKNNKVFKMFLRF